MADKQMVQNSQPSYAFARQLRKQQQQAESERKSGKPLEKHQPTDGTNNR